MYVDGNRAPSCPCATAVKRKGNLVAMVEMMIKLDDGHELKVKDFTSKSFTNTFLKNGSVPNGM